MVNTRHFNRSRRSRVLAGVAGGLGQYFDVDPVLFRIGFVLMALTPAAPMSIVGYIVLAIVMPESPSGEFEPEIRSSVTIGRGGQTAGVLLIGFGLLLLAANMGFFALVRWDLFWPLVLVAAGALLLANRFRS
jgi:phage shock protein PspC (stress-responsive transcriptional regulator)